MHDFSDSFLIILFFFDQSTVDLYNFPNYFFDFYSFIFLARDINVVFDQNSCHHLVKLNENNGKALLNLLFSFIS